MAHAPAADAAATAAQHGGTGALIFDGFVLLGAALIFVLAFRKLGLGAVLGYLIAGIAIGPHGLGFVEDPESILTVAEIGIILLLFLVGLELAPMRLWRMRANIFGFGLLQVVLCGLALTGFILLATDFSWQAALALGLPLALSSTAQVLPMLQSGGRLNTPPGERAFSALLFQDLSIVPLLTVIAVLSRAPADPGAPPGWLLAIYTLLAVVGLVLAGRYLLNPLFRLVGRIAEREMFIVAGLFTVFLAAALMDMLGVSMALGAFVAGVVLADSPYRHEIEADVDPFRSILLGLFFLAVGMMLDVEAIREHPGFVVAMAAGLVAIKTAVIFGLAMAFGNSWRVAFVLGMLLSQGGEFAFVLFAEAQGALLIEPEAASLFGAIVTLSMATTPFLMAVTRTLGGIRQRMQPAPERHDLETPQDREDVDIIVVGHGRFGQTVSQMLLAANVKATVIDSKPSQIDVSNEFGRKVYYGDGTRIDLLRQAGAEHAAAILFCIDGTGLDAASIAPIRTAFPHALIFVRVFDRLHYLAVKGGEAHGVVREVFESAVTMARDAMIALELDDVVISRAEEEYRARDKRRLRAQFETGDMRAGAEHSFGTDMSQPLDY